MEGSVDQLHMEHPVIVTLFVSAVATTFTVTIHASNNITACSSRKMTLSFIAGKWLAYYHPQF